MGKPQQPDSAIFGKFQLAQSENFDEFMKTLGVSYLVRTLGAKSTPVVTISKDDNDLFTFKQESLVSTSQINFKIGEQFDEKTADGRQVNICYNCIIITGCRKIAKWSWFQAGSLMPSFVSRVWQSMFLSMLIFRSSP